MSGKPGIGVVELLDDEWLPHEPPRLQPLDPNWTPVQQAVSFGDNVSLGELLAQGKVSREERDYALWTAAQFSDEPAILKMLLNAGANVNARDGEGRTALSVAEHNGSAEVVRLLKEAGAKE